MSQYYPKPYDIIKDPLTNDVVMNKESFSDNFRNMFPQGRQFLNHIQLREAVKIFFKHWNLLSKTSSKEIRCSFSHSPAKKICEIADTHF